MTSPRGTLAGQLAAMGFADTARAQQRMTELGADATLLQAIAGAADPDLALAALARLAPDSQLRQALRTDPVLLDRLVSVLGGSAALGEHLIRHTADWRLLADSAPFPSEMSRDGPDPVTQLRVA